jgi:hypothetical protein
VKYIGKIEKPDKAEIEFRMNLTNYLPNTVSKEYGTEVSIRNRMVEVAVGPVQSYTRGKIEFKIGSLGHDIEVGHEFESDFNALSGAAGTQKESVVAKEMLEKMIGITAIDVAYKLLNPNKNISHADRILVRVEMTDLNYVLARAGFSLHQ